MQRRKLIQAAGAGMLGSLGASSISGALGLFASTPSRADDAIAWGRPANAILVVGGDYIRYRRILENAAAGLEKIGLIAHAPKNLSETRSDTLDIWQALAENAGGTRLRFLPDGHYDYAFDAKRREAVRESVLRRIREQGDVDLILTFGTETSFDMKENVKDIPIISLGSSDPVKTGLVASVEDSGSSNFHALVEEGFYYWQASVFHTILPFRKLALVTADSRIEKTGADDIRAFCEENGLGFELQTYVESRKHEETDFQALLDAVAQAVEGKGCDAIIFPWFRVTDEEFPRLVAYLEKKRIPSFSQTGPEFVSRGILLGVGDENLEGYGLFEADVIQQVLDGEEPRSIKQGYTQRSRLAMNLYSAMQMGWQPPFELLVSVERAYTTQSPHLN